MGKRMRNLLKQLIINTPIYHLMRNWLHKKRHKRELEEWVNSGRPVPPPHIVKQQVLMEFAEQYGLQIFVETGTYYGDMVEAMKGFFVKIYSIEVSKELFLMAKKRFKYEKHIELIHGDSGNVLENVMTKIDQPALFWLDGHYSFGVTSKGEEETPINRELQSILNAQKKLGHVIIIDDARCFGTDPAYPTIHQLEELICSKRDIVKITVKDDSIRIVLSE